MPTLYNATNSGYRQQYQASAPLSADEIDMLLAKLARGHISTAQEEYADLKRVLCRGD